MLGEDGETLRGARRVSLQDRTRRRRANDDLFGSSGAKRQRASFAYVPASFPQLTTKYGVLMRRVSLLGALLVVLSLAVAASAGAAGVLTGPGTIRITDRQVKHIHVDGGPRGKGAGDEDFYRELLYNRGITAEPIGHSDIMCTNTGTGSANCSGTYFLPKGKLMVAGVLAERLLYELAVIGGTGFYQHARGTLTGTVLGGSPRHELLMFRLSL